MVVLVITVCSRTRGTSISLYSQFTIDDCMKRGDVDASLEVSVGSKKTCRSKCHSSRKWAKDSLAGFHSQLESTVGKSTQKYWVGVQIFRLYAGLKMHPIRTFTCFSSFLSCRSFQMRSDIGRREKIWWPIRAQPKQIIFVPHSELTINPLWVKQLPAPTFTHLLNLWSYLYLFCWATLSPSLIGSRISPTSPMVRKLIPSSNVTWPFGTFSIPSWYQSNSGDQRMAVSCYVVHGSQHYHHDHLDCRPGILLHGKCCTRIICLLTSKFLSFFLKAIVVRGRRIGTNSWSFYDDTFEFANLILLLRASLKHFLVEATTMNNGRIMEDGAVLN